jgi:hypothetical protein
MWPSFDSYTERSASGRGTHIIVKGKVPKGVRRGHTELYSDRRFMICTGDVIRALPIVERQSMLDNMYQQMKVDAGSPISYEDQDEEFTDRQIHERALAAANGEKYDMLTRNDVDWRDHYGSQSEADLALVSILMFHSKNSAQVKRMFRASPLGQREKATREDYLDQTIHRAASRLVTSLVPVADHVMERISKKAADHKRLPTLTYPAGLVGAIARYIAEAALRPVDEVAIAGALGLTAGIAGGAYDTHTGSGLNLYQIVLAKTGCGKEAAQHGIERLMSYVRQSVPASDGFLGPSHFASGQAILKALNDQPAFLSVLGEIGITLQTWCDPRANAAEQLILKVLLDCYGKSGADNVIRPLAYSNQTKNTKMIIAPSLCILGESVPSKFYETLDSSHIDSGLLARFLVVEYEGDRPAENDNPVVQPQQKLIDDIIALTMSVLEMQQKKKRRAVQADDDAQLHLKEFSLQCDLEIRMGDEITAQLWNRAHLNALRIASVIAIGNDCLSPTIDLDAARWACDFVKRSICGLVRRFEEGLSVRSRAYALVETQIEKYLKMTPKDRIKNGAPKGCAELGIVPFRFLFLRLSKHHVFASDRRGDRAALEETLKTFVDCGRLQSVELSDARKLGGRGAKYYSVTAEW